MIKTNIPEFENDFFETVRPFGLSDGNFLLDVFYEKADAEGNEIVSCKFEQDGREVHKSENIAFGQRMGALEKKRIRKRTGKNLAYKAISELTDKRLPWGSLTGIRPSVLAYSFLLNGGRIEEIPTHFRESYDVSEGNADIIKEIIKNQRDICIKNPKNAGLYVNIPICTSRCDYCSFISAIKDKCKNIPAYASLLQTDVHNSLRLIKEKEMKLRSVYVGGGTPTSIEPEQLSMILEPISSFFEAEYLKKGKRLEFTVEAGRADTITKEHLNILKKHNVTRISINPQTFNDETLALIGRKHTAKDVFDAFSMVRDYDFDVNMDLIAGFENETLDDFKYSLNTAVSLGAQNITIHTLCLKRGSVKQAKNETPSNPYTAEMVDYSKKALRESDYAPYYLYRQKNVLENLENTGYALNGKQCVHNIDAMEENASIFASGAGAISKRLFFGTEKLSDEYNVRIERYANPKFIDDYIERFDKIIKKKHEFWA